MSDSGYDRNTVEGYLLALGAAEVGAVGVLRKLFIEALSAESVAALGQEARHEIP